MLNSSSGRKKAESDSSQSEVEKSARCLFFASILKLALFEKMSRFLSKQLPNAIIAAQNGARRLLCQGSHKESGRHLAPKIDA